MDVLKNYKKLQEDFKFEFDLKKEQEEIIDSILKKQHTFGILPTGFGKSLTFIVPPLLMDISIPSVRHHTIVICPLVALMKDQCSSLQRRGVSATYISQRSDMDDATVEGIREGAYTVLYMSPEALVTMEWRCLIFDNSIYKNCTTIAVDEVHLLELWGDEFRPTFRAIGELRSHFPDTPFLLLSATVEEEMYSRILHHLHIGSDEVTLVAADPDRPNLFLEWRTATRADASNHLLPYLEKLKETQLDCPKSIIYVRTFSQLGTILKFIMTHLGDKAYTKEGRNINDRLVAQYHGSMFECDQNLLLSEFVKEDSKVRLVIATVAFGMGVDIPDIRHVVHWGVPDSFIEYWQEVGRAGRDGKPAQTLLIALPSPTPHANKSVKELVKSICTSSKCNSSVPCLRETILASLHVPGMRPGRTDSRRKCSSACDECQCAFCTCCFSCRHGCLCRN